MKGMGITELMGFGDEPATIRDSHRVCRRGFCVLQGDGSWLEAVNVAGASFRKKGRTSVWEPLVRSTVRAVFRGKCYESGRRPDLKNLWTESCKIRIDSLCGSVGHWESDVKYTVE